MKTKAELVAFEALYEALDEYLVDMDSTTIAVKEWTNIPFDEMTDAEENTHYLKALLKDSGNVKIVVQFFCFDDRDGLALDFERDASKADLADFGFVQF